MILYSCFLVAICVVVALFYVLCKISRVHYAVAVNANPSHGHRSHNYYAAIVYITLFYSSARIFYYHFDRLSSDYRLTKYLSDYLDLLGLSSSGDFDSDTDEGRRRRKERSLEELERLLGDLKTDAD